MATSQFPSIELSRLLYSSSRLLIQRIQLTLNDFGLTYPQFLALSVLWKEDGLLVNQIGEKLHLDSGTLTPMLKKLEALNFVKRQRSEEDERTVKIELTYPGKSLQAKVEKSLQALEETFSEIEDPNLSALNHSVEKLLEVLKQLKNA